MDTIQQLKDEFSEEYNITKKFFKVYPDGKNDYAPHAKSMKMLNLSTHIADIFGWPAIILVTSDLDFADEHPRDKVETREELEAQLDKQYNAAITALEKIEEKDLYPTWSISMKGQKIKEWTRYGAIRHALNQITHHRAQLGVYYRLLDIPLPGSYGPSADDQSF